MTHAVEPELALVVGIRDGLAAHADPIRAEQQQRYMKSSLPYYGLPSPLVALVCRELFATHRIDDRDVWEATARELWDRATHREEWYAAIHLVRHRPYRDWAQDPSVVPLLRHLITTGAWWDVVDDVATHLVGDLLRENPDEMEPIVRTWAIDPNPWLRRTAIICQVGSKRDTDADLLADTIEPNLSATGFFLRKAIGWALRDYARWNPGWVRTYVAEHRDRMSGLSVREALKHLEPS